MTPIAPFPMLTRDHPPTTSMARDRDSNRRTPPAPPMTTVHQAQRPGVVHKNVVPIAQCPTTCTATTNGHNTAPPPPRPPVGGHHQHPHNHRTPGPKALALRTRARRRSPKAQPCTLPPPTPMTVRNRHRNPGEPMPTPSTTLHWAAMPRRCAQEHDVDHARRRTDNNGTWRRREPCTPHARGPAAPSPPPHRQAHGPGTVPERGMARRVQGMAMPNGNGSGPGNAKTVR